MNQQSHLELSVSREMKTSVLADFIHVFSIITPNGQGKHPQYRGSRSEVGLAQGWEGIACKEARGANLERCRHSCEFTKAH